MPHCSTLASAHSGSPSPWPATATERVRSIALASAPRRRTSSRRREAVALRFGADLTVPDIAKVTGEPLTTVEGRVYRALRKLRDELA